uniref:Uncharacterized protein n=1 Tax=Oryza sativa subsp. japonica TaxID=39947 RepID=Q8H585_ORYSJ|nr:hypothetical protein [Oryza sativa Japonica Group]BAD30792.1 hypothetical protein [Oryza sativa Japonica Group]
MSDRPKLHFLAKVAARLSLILAIMMLEIPFIQMAAGLSALVFAPILMVITLIILGCIWWWSEPEIVCRFRLFLSPLPTMCEEPKKSNFRLSSCLSIGFIFFSTMLPHEEHDTAHNGATLLESVAKGL